MTTIVIVPGLRDEMPDHWQSILARAEPTAVCLPRLTTEKLRCAAWVDLLDQTLTKVKGPVVLVAHSAGVMITVHWARERMNGKSIKGALLATPPDFERPLPAGYPTQATLQTNGWLPIPRDPLPFPTIVAASTNDPLASPERASEFARHWGSRLVDVGAVGHLNPVAGFGPWPRANEFVRALMH